jgi:ubiquinone/menaquinone biosynthesis C-methylase UbiE
MKIVDFDRTADDYRSTVDRSLGFTTASVDQLAETKANLLLDLMARYIGEPQGLKFLDVGCGIGLVERGLRDRVAEIHGIDISEASLAHARTAAPGARFQHYDGSRIPYDEATFDAVVTICVLHHIQPSERPAFIKEMVRVARPGGMVLILEHNPMNPVTRHIVSRCPLDADASLLGRTRARRLLATPELSKIRGGYLAFWPYRSARVERMERRIGWLPLGAQFYTWALKD